MLAREAGATRYASRAHGPAISYLFDAFAAPQHDHAQKNQRNDRA